MTAGGFPMLDDTTTLGIAVNGAQCQTSARTVADLVAERGLVGQKVATAVNGDFVPAARRADVGLKAGDRVEIVSPRQGG